MTPHEIYRNTATTLNRQLSEKGHIVRTFELPKQASKLVAIRPPQAPASQPSDPEVNTVLKEAVDSRPAVFVTIGEAATLLTLEGTESIPVVYCTVTNALDLPTTVKDDPRSARAAGVTTDVDPKQQIQWVKKVQPQARTIGVLCSSHSRRTAEAIKRVAEPAGIKTVVIETSKEDFVKAVDTLTAQECEGVLMLADARIYDATTARHLLLWGVRNKKSVWAFSENFVKAGALGASYGDTDLMLKQTVDVVGKVISGTNPATIGIQYPSQVLRAINERTAGLLGLKVPQELLDAADARHGGSE